MVKWIVIICVMLLSVPVIAAPHTYHANTASTVVRSTGAASASAAVIKGLYYRVVCTEICFLNEGATATSSHMYIPEETPEIFLARDTTFHFIQLDTAGNCYITPLN